MPKMCCVGGCSSNYKKEEEYTKVFRFPSDAQERQCWLDKLPNILNKVTGDTVICEKHWPSGYETYKKKGSLRPVHPPSIFQLPASFQRQNTTTPRNVESRNVDAESRRRTSEERNPVLDPDLIASWEDLANYCSELSADYIKKEDKIIISEISGDPPCIRYSVSIFKDFSISAYHGSTKVPCSDLVNGFTYKIERYSQIPLILERAKMSENSVNQEFLNVSKNIRDIVESSGLGVDVKSKVTFLMEQLLLLSKKPNGLRYDTSMMRTAISLYLRSRNCYAALREYLTLPHPNTIKSYFGDLGSPGDLNECENTIKSVLDKLSGEEKYCKILVDEIHIKPAVRYQGNHVIGFSHDEPSKAARTVLAIMVVPSMGKPAFVCRLIPMYSMKAVLLLEETKKVIELVHKHSGYAFLLMTDNLRTNQSCFAKYRETFGSDNDYSCKHPVSNDEFQILFLLYDPTHLLKNIRNNWHTEKMQKLQFVNPEDGKTVVAKWSDLVTIYKLEVNSIVKTTKLNYATLYPTNFEKQKVSLAMNIFNEKTVAALFLHKLDDTAIFVQAVTKLWNCLNVKSPVAGRNLNDPNREPFRSPDDTRFQFLNQMTNKFSDMDTSKSKYSTRVMCLTVDTSRALVLTLTGLTELIKLLLSKGFKYVLPGVFQSDRLEGEFGTFRQSAGGCYYISFKEILNSLTLQRLKLFNRLDIDKNSVHVRKDCCSASLTEKEVDMLDQCFHLTGELTDEERSSLYYIAGYVAKKHDLCAADEEEKDSNKKTESEFTTLLSRGKLSYPTSELYDLTCVLYNYYKNVEKECIEHLLVAFHEIYESSFLNFDSEEKILRRLINCFSKAFANQQSDKIRLEKNKIKRRRLHYE